MTDDLIQRTRMRLMAKAEALRQEFISVGDLAHALRLAPSTTRQLGIPAHFNGKRDAETLYLRDDVRAFLCDRNDGADFWPEDDLLLPPRETCVILTSHGVKVTPSTLAKWRERNSGPAWVRISHGTVRYKQSALYSWLRRKKEKSQ